MRENLNKSQLEAVTTTEGPLLIIAGPGSGKTKTLVERTVYLLVKKKIKPENILLSTFTEKAASELISRISDRLKELNIKTNLNEMYVGTLHSIFRRLIEENIDDSDFYGEFNVLDDTEQLFFVYTKINIFRKLNGYKSFFKNIPCMNSWERSKKIVQWMDILNEHGKNLEEYNSKHPDIIFLKEAQEKYKNLLIENNVIDFSTIQAQLLQMLLKNPELLENISSKLKYIMIDEYQDTNNIQEKLIFLLGQKYKNICVVGDDDQAIYRFRGATIENILEFPNRFEEGKCKKITLNINYRSQLDIIRTCNTWINLIDWGKYRYPKEMIENKDKPISPTSSVIRIGGENESQWIENLCRFIKNLRSTGKITNYNQIAFLCRSVQNLQIKALKKYFEEEKIPVYSPRSKDFFEKEEIILSIGALLVYFPQTKYLVFDKVKNRTNEIFYYYNNNCLEKMRKIVREDEKFYKWIVEKRHENAKKNVDFFPNLKSVFYSFFQFDCFKKLFKLGNSSELEKNPTHNLAIFTDILDKYETLTKISEIPKEQLDTYIRYFFMTYLRQLREKKMDEFENKENFPKEAIPFLTFHQAKGLEFPVVIVDSLYLDPFPQTKTYEDELKKMLKLDNTYEPAERKNTFDLWRLYYTAFSRAQDLLVLTSIENRNGNKRSPSNTFSYLFYRAPEWKDSENFEIKHLDISEVKENENRKLLSYSSNIALYDFCPLKYQFLKEFNFIENKDPETFYGIFYHKVLERVHNHIITYNEKPDKDKIRNIILDVEKFMHVTAQITFNESISENIFKTVNKYLENLDIKNIVACELKISNVQKDFIIEGVFDLVKKREDIYEIIDFKSGDFNDQKLHFYKKQLALYRYLLQEEYQAENINTYLYFENETDPYIKVQLEKEDMENIMKKFNKTAENILNKDFPPRKFDSQCEKCDFRWFCKNDTNEEKGEN
ncbi:ATP-dependent DNA helicase [Fusobacterium sp.]|uniref:ATP-dependent DNA helicase n=1 Tax=Fusobacterium sp. TaxID=68766 RepID=UPI00396C4DF2